MIWTVVLKNGSVIKEHDSGKIKTLKDIDPNTIEKFMITETGNEMNVPFSSDTGVIKFSNLDLRELSKLDGGERLIFVYDKDAQVFKLGDKSL